MMMIWMTTMKANERNADVCCLTPEQTIILLFRNNNRDCLGQRVLSQQVPLGCLEEPEFNIHLIISYTITSRPHLVNRQIRVQELRSHSSHQDINCH